ncbi:hypothetical protein [Devosia sp. 2618]|uniref:COG4223 family protein n=1 Tax=Devosia sp. 2618 TaxID=3156454 RepID=UPI0033991860
MADTKGTQSKPTDPKTGPVKPPVLDLKARETVAKTDAKDQPAATEPKDKPAETRASQPAAAKTAEMPSSLPPPPIAPTPAAPAKSSGFAFGAAITGGAIGLVAAYGLASVGLWPTTPAPAPAADPRIAQFASSIPELETVTQTTQSELATLNQRISAIESAEPAATPVAAPSEPTDLTGIETEIAALMTRMDTLAATPAPAADTATLDGLRSDLAALGTRLDELGARVGTAEAGLRTLDTTMTETTATLAAQPTDIGAVLQLPLILSGFETAFATGRPYGTELGALRAAVPSATIPTAIANAAETGLTRPDVIASRFADALPAMLAGRPADPQAQWQDGALDWFRSAIALRPTGEIEGDTPEAIMSRLDGAIARRDFVTAESLFASLPAPMISAGGDLQSLVKTQADATRFLDSLRNSALSGEAAR